MGPETVQRFVQDVKASGDPARAERDRRYHKSTRQHWGITMPQLDNVVKRHAGQHTPEQLLQLARQLWDSDIYDLMTAAGRILGRPEITATPELWEILDLWLEDIDGWALEDVLALQRGSAIWMTRRYWTDLRTGRDIPTSGADGQCSSTPAHMPDRAATRNGCCHGPPGTPRIPSGSSRKL